MAKSAYTIRMDYDKALQQADKLEKMAKELKRTAGSSLDQCLNSVNSAWKSDSSVRYIRKGRRLKEDIERQAGELEKAADVIRTIARNTYNAEMKALQIAQKGSHSG